MSHHSHIGGHSAHLHTPPVKLGPTHYEGTKYTPQVNPEEGKAAGGAIGQVVRWFLIGTFGSLMYGGASVIDTLRLKTPTAEFFVWHRVPAMWLGLLSLGLLATGWPGYYLMLLICLVLAFASGGAIVLWLGGALPIPVLNALLAIPIPAVGPRLELMGKLLEPAGRGQELTALAHTSLGGVPLLEWYTRLDWASLAIPFVLTLVATVKYIRLARARKFIDDGDDCECLPASPGLTAWFGFGLLVAACGLPGSPFGLWTLLACFGWFLFGKTKPKASEVRSQPDYVAH